MILLITPSPRADECARAIQEAIGENTQYADSLRQAAKLLRCAEYTAIIFDDYLVQCDPDGAEVLLQHAGPAVPVYVNLAISGSQRVARELKQTLQRTQQEREAVQRQAELALRNQLNDSVTALLLSCELALAVPQVPPAAQAKMRAACELARDIRGRLGAETNTAVARRNGGGKS